MTDKKTIKVGDAVYIKSNRLANATYKDPIPLKITGIDSQSRHPYKGVSMAGTVFYCSEDEIVSVNPAKKAAARKAAVKTAVDARMGQIKEKLEKEKEQEEEVNTDKVETKILPEAANKKPTYREVEDKFMALCKAGLEHPDDVAIGTVIDLAAKQIFTEIKDGVVWE